MENELPKGAVRRALLLAILSTIGGVVGVWAIWTVVRALK
jgi:hypothetical protein